MFSEMRALAVKDKTVSPLEILKMATVNSARALGLTEKIGELSKNALADLIAIPFAGNISESFEATVNFSSRIHASMIDGQFTIAPK
jgi:imidazolonepropionase-like amidohydrolase